MVLLDTETPGTSRELYSEDANGETQTSNPSVINQMLLPLKQIGQIMYLVYGEIIIFP